MCDATGSSISEPHGLVFLEIGWELCRYRAFFLAAAGLHALSVTLLFLVDPVAEQKRNTAALLAGAGSAAGAHYYSG